MFRKDLIYFSPGQEVTGQHCQNGCGYNITLVWGEIAISKDPVENGSKYDPRASMGISFTTAAEKFLV